MSAPKVLIVGPSFCYIGGGITMSNLFAGWDADKIAVACIPYFLNQKVNTAICDNYYQLGSEERKAAFPLSLLNSKSPSGPVKPSATLRSVPPKKSDRPGLRHRLVMDVINPLLEYSGLSHSMFRTGLSGRFKKWLGEFNPDIIYAQAFTYEDLLFCMAVHDHLKKPMAFHMMDDWPSSISTKGPFKGIWYRKIDSAFRQLLNKSTLLLGISEDMATEYQQRYGRYFVPFHNPIQIAFWKKDQKKTYELQAPPIVLYAGRVGLGIDSSLQTIAGAIEKVNKETNNSIRFVLHTEEKPGWLDNFECAQFKSYVPYNDIPKTLSAADFLALPYDFSKDSINYIKYSIPTKVTEYMMSGTPIILFGPEGIALVNYARKHQCFELVTQNDPGILAVAIRKLVAEKNYRETIGRTAASIAETDHDAAIVTKEFRDLLASMTNGTPKAKMIANRAAMH